MAHGRYAWVAHVPWLPDSLDDGDRYELESLDRGYLNLAEALSGAAPMGSALQMRVLSRGSDPSTGAPGLLSAWVVGAASSVDDCTQLWALTSAALPSGVPLEVATPASTAGVMGWVSRHTEGGVCEIRRRVEDTRPIPGLTLDSPLDGTVLRWEAAPHALRNGISMLRSQPGRSSLVLHMERTIPSESLMLRLADSFHAARNEVRDASGGEYSAVFARLVDEARLRLRILPRGALCVRVALASEKPIRVGLAEAFGLDLTGLGGFEVARPVGVAEITDAMSIFTEADARAWGDDLDPELEELRYICDPAEAGSVVRFPEPPRGGLPGLNSIPTVTLPRSPQPPPATLDARGVTLGNSPHGGDVELTLGELNQHTLVVGLPGFGKTSTVHRILQALWNDHHVPFLVIDPAKGDYDRLLPALVAHGDRTPQRITLTPERMAFNPFVVPAGCTTATHAGRVLGAMDAALQISGHWPMGYVTLTRGVFRAYEECAQGDSPTLRSVYAALGDVIRTTPLDPRSRADVTGSLLGRLESLVRGPLGSALTGGADAGIDWDDLLSRPTVIELRGFAGPAERSLMFGLVIAGLMSIRESRGRSEGSGLVHVTVLEEAHRLLGNRGGVEAEGVRLLSEAIAELRGSGQGFVVVDQAPTLLHPVVRKVCGSVIAHRLIEPAEREAAGSAMLLAPRQIEDLARLQVGRAVVYGAARSAPVLAQIKPLEVGATASWTHTNTITGGSVEPLFCVGCTSMCRHRRAGSAISTRNADFGRRAIDLIDSDVVKRLGVDAVWCAIAHQSGAEFVDAPAGVGLQALHERRQMLLDIVQRGHEK